MITMRILRVLDVEKVAYELSGSFARVGAPQADNDTKGPEDFHKNIFLVKTFDLHLLYSYQKIFNYLFLFTSRPTGQQNM